MIQIRHFLQTVVTTVDARGKLTSWQIECAAFLDEPAPSAESAAPAQAPQGYLFQGQLSQVPHDNALMARQVLQPHCGLSCTDMYMYKWVTESGTGTGRCRAPATSKPTSRADAFASRTAGGES